MKKTVFEVENFAGVSMSVSTTYEIKGDGTFTVATEALNEFKDSVSIESDAKVDVVVTKSIAYSEAIKNVDQVNITYVVNEDGKLVFAGSEEIKKDRIG
jgi:hypothetical protein